MVHGCGLVVISVLFLVGITAIASEEGIDCLQLMTSQDNSKESYRHIHKTISSVWQPSVDDKMPQVLFVPGNHEDMGVLQDVFQEVPAFVGPGCDLLPVTATVGAWRVLLLASHVPPGRSFPAHAAVTKVTAAAAADGGDGHVGGDSDMAIAMAMNFVLPLLGSQGTPSMGSCRVRHWRQQRQS